MSIPQLPTDFLACIREKMDGLSKKESAVAEFMAQNREKIIYFSITELAEQTHTSEATITRLCLKLGYGGFQMLKLSVARELIAPQKQIHEQLNPGDSADMIIEKVFNSALETLQQTKAVLDSEAIDRCITVLEHCEKLVILGCGNSAAIAMDAYHKFLRLGKCVQAHADGHMQMIAVSALTERDVVIGISHSGSSRDISQALFLAKKNGATVISITANGNSPVSKLSTISLHTDSPETKFRTYAISSRMAELTILDTLYTGVSLRMGPVALARFEALEQALVVKKY